MDPFGALRNLDWSDNRVRIGAAGIGVVGVYLFLHNRSVGASGDPASVANASAPIPDTFGTTDAGNGTPGVLGSVGSYPVPSPTSPAPTKPKIPPRGSVAVTLLNRKTGKPYVSDFTVTTDKPCPAGYTRVVGTNGKPECVSVDERVTGKRTIGAVTQAKGAKAGEAFSGMDTYVGKTGGVFPAPMPLTAHKSYTVQDGDTPGSIAQKVYGGSHWAGRLVNLNGPIGQLQSGQKLRVS